MKFLSRCGCICIVFAIFIAVGVEGVAYGANCTGKGTGNCTEKNNTVCNSTCKCATNSFRKSTPECAKKIALKQNCTAEQPADQCADANAACDATALKCQCKSAHFVSKTSGACEPEIALKQNCTTGQPPDQCADANAVCDATALTCQCKSAHFLSKTSGACKPVVPALNGACDVSDSALDQCAIANSTCRNAGTDKCLCKTTHYVKGAACVIRIVPGATCVAKQCVTHASCNTTSKCQCDVGYTATPTAKPTICSGVTKVTTLLYMFVMPILLSMMFLLQ